MTAGQVLAYYYIDSKDRICCEAGNMAGDSASIFHIKILSGTNLIKRHRN